MAFIYRDFLTPARLKFNGIKRFYNLFTRLWGTTTYNGVEVYNSRYYLWTKSGGLNDSASALKFYKLLGLDLADLRSQNYKGLENVYLYFKSSQAYYVAPELSTVVDKLDFSMPPDTEYELSVTYTTAFGASLDSHFVYKGSGNTTDILNYTVDTSAIWATLTSDPMRYFANNTTISLPSIIRNVADITGSLLPNSVNGSTNVPAPVTYTIQVVTAPDEPDYGKGLALLDNGTSVTVSNPTKVVITQNGLTVDVTYRVTCNVINEITSSSYLATKVKQLADDIDNANIVMNPYDTTLKQAVFDMAEEADLTNDMVYQGRIRVNPLNNTKVKDQVPVLAKMLIVGYTQEKLSWWEKAFLAVLFVVTLYIGMPYLYTAVTAATVGATIAAFATAFAVMSIALTVGLLVFSVFSPYSFRAIRIIGKIAQIVGIASAIFNILNWVQNKFRMMAEEAAKTAAEEAAKNGATQAELKLLKEFVISDYSISDFVSDMFQGMFDSVTTALDKMFSMDSISNFSPAKLGTLFKDFGTWIQQMYKAYTTVNSVFANDSTKPMPTEKDQAVKEDGVEEYYVALQDMSDPDALQQMDKITHKQNGLNQTDMFMAKIY
jgi:Sec-independent protein translocase protein TatA